MIVKELPRKTVCTLFKIRTPIWNAGKRKVGLDAQKIGVHNEIEFSYVRKSDGQKSFPDQYYISGEKIKALDYDRMNVSGGVTLVLVPFDQLEKLVRV